MPAGKGLTPSRRNKSLKILSHISNINALDPQPKFDYYVEIITTKLTLPPKQKNIYIQKIYVYSFLSSGRNSGRIVCLLCEKNCF